MQNSNADELLGWLVCSLHPVKDCPFDTNSIHHSILLIVFLFMISSNGKYILKNLLEIDISKDPAEAIQRKTAKIAQLALTSYQK